MYCRHDLTPTCVGNFPIGHDTVIAAAYHALLALGSLMRTYYFDNDNLQLVYIWNSSDVRPINHVKGEHFE
jgi:hypothetical protein